jgi:hypothetical protein
LKTNIDNPQAGSILTKTRAFAFQRFNLIKKDARQIKIGDILWWGILMNLFQKRCIDYGPIVMYGDNYTFHY